MQFCKTISSVSEDRTGENSKHNDARIYRGCQNVSDTSIQVGERIIY